MKILPGNDGETSGGIVGRAGSAAAVILSVLALLQVAYLAMTTKWSNSMPATIQHIKPSQGRYIATNLSSTSLRNISSNREVDSTINTTTLDNSNSNHNVTTKNAELGNQSLSRNFTPADTSLTTTGKHSHVETANNTSSPLSSIPSSQDDDSRPTTATNAGPQPTLLQNLGGELGNHLGYIMHGFAVKWYAQEAFGLDLELLTLHQNHRKWVRGKDDMLQCFPKFKDWNFDRDETWDQFQEIKQQQKAWLSEERQEALDHVNDNPKDGTAFNDSLIAYLEEYSKMDKPQAVEDSEISLPFLQSKGSIPKYFFDKYFDRIREMLQFNTSSESGCCAILPDEDETVFHYRNFATEVPKGVHGLMDFGPNQTARDLFGHLNHGDKVAIITRFKNEKSEEQVNALRARGLQVRLITDQTGVQDFCILLRAKKEVVGLALSTFAIWGSLLGSARTIRLFVPVGYKLLDHHGSLESVKRGFLYNYTHPDISKRLNISLVPLDE